jgi:hypothetical protein
MRRRVSLRLAGTPSLFSPPSSPGSAAQFGELGNCDQKPPGSGACSVRGWWWSSVFRGWIVRLQILADIQSRLEKEALLPFSPHLDRHEGEKVVFTRPCSYLT